MQLLIIKPKISDEEFLSWVSRIPELARRKYDSRTLAMFFVVRKAAQAMGWM